MNKKGFTLIELLIVIAIIGILSAILIPNLLGARKKAVFARAQTFSNTTLKEIVGADFKNLNGYWKTTDLSQTGSINSSNIQGTYNTNSISTSALPAGMVWSTDAPNKVGNSIYLPTNGVITGAAGTRDASSTGTTFGFWVKGDSATTTLIIGESSSLLNLWLNINNSTITLSSYTESTGTQSPTAISKNIFDNTWHYVLCTKKYGGNITLYIDGESVISTSIPSGDSDGTNSSMTIQVGTVGSNLYLADPFLWNESFR